MERKIVFRDVPPVPEEIKNVDVLASFVANALDLIPRRGKGDVAIKMLQIFARIAGRREDTISVGGRNVKIKNGAIRIEDLHHWLKTEGVEIGLSQLYSTYVARFLERGLIVKKKHSMYGLRAERLEDTILEVLSDAETIARKIAVHARRLDVQVRAQGSKESR